LKHLKGYRWQEADWKDVKDVEYDKFVPTAHGILIGTIRTITSSSAQIRNLLQI
jgi:hypothetical protein